MTVQLVIALEVFLSGERKEMLMREAAEVVLFFVFSGVTAKISQEPTLDDNSMDDGLTEATAFSEKSVR